MEPIGVKVEALSLCMYPCIGATTAMGFYRGIENIAECGFDAVLDSFAVGLALPAVKIRSVVRAYAFPSHATMLAKVAKDARLSYKDGG